MATYTQVVPSAGDAQELLAKIQRTHLSYLQLDDDSQKLKLRWELEDLITSHLSIVPHKEKFPCQRFLEILRRSIEDKSEFNSAQAAQAFDVLERYAHNLISQPWRKEFRCFKLYNGFYKHQVESKLSCTEEVLGMMGYEEGEFMEMNLDGPVDPDRVIDVSLNCLIAVVECKIMGEIMDKVTDCSWSEIASARRHNVCGVAKTAQLVTRMNVKRHRLHAYPDDRAPSKSLHESWSNQPKNNSRYVKVEKLVDDNDSSLLMEADRRYPHSFYGSKWEEKPSSNGHHPAYDFDYFIPKTTDEHINLQNLFLTDGRQLKYTPDVPEIGPRKDSWSRVERMQQPQRSVYNNNNNCYDLGRRKLFSDVQPLFPNQSYLLSRSVKHQPAPTVEDIYRSVLCRRTFPPKLCSAPPSRDLGVESALYAPSPYLSRPTLAAEHIYRGNVHYPATTTTTTAPALSNFEVLPKINNCSVTAGGQQKSDDLVMETCDGLQRMKMSRDKEVDRKSWYDNVDSGESVEAVQQGSRRVVNNGDVLPPPTQFQNEPDLQPSSTTIRASSLGHRRWPSDGSGIVRVDRDTNKFISSASFDGKMTSGWSSKDEEMPSVVGKKLVPSNSTENRLPGTWSCLACTYLNPADCRICEMCSRSRCPGAESDPLSSGGHECQKCTLVNAKGAPKCLACGQSLENSPTYV